MLDQKSNIIIYYCGLVSVLRERYLLVRVCPKTFYQKYLSTLYYTGTLCFISESSTHAKHKIFRIQTFHI